MSYETLTTTVSAQNHELNAGRGQIEASVSIEVESTGGDLRPYQMALLASLKTSVEDQLDLFTVPETRNADFAVQMEDLDDGGD